MTVSVYVPVLSLVCDINQYVSIDTGPTEINSTITIKCTINWQFCFMYILESQADLIRLEC